MTDEYGNSIELIKQHELTDEKTNRKETQLKRMLKVKHVKVEKYGGTRTMAKQAKVLSDKELSKLFKVCELTSYLS